MDAALQHNLYLVKEHLGYFKTTNNYDLLDPSTGQMVLACRESKQNMLTQLFRLTKYKKYTPFDMLIQSTDGQPLVRIKRGIALFLSKVAVYDGDDQLLGSFQQRFLSLGGAFQVLSARDEPLCELKGKWTGWDFRFLAGEAELARVTKKWQGIGRELLTSADNYMVEISPEVPPDNPLRQLILAAVVCIDMVLKE